VQAATFALVAIAGILGGLAFPLAASVALENRSGASTAAGGLYAADNLGACAGALVTGVLLVPILGVSGACLAVVGMKALSALFVGAADRTV
jgi:spermidine synthase